MSDFPVLEPGLTGEASTVVTDAQTARALGSGNVNVYSTPAMIALLEAAAVAALADQLREGQSSVGTGLNVKHVAATPLGMTVRAKATLTEVDGRRLVFDVAAWDDVELIGQGTHERFLIDRERFEARVRQKEQ